MLSSGECPKPNACGTNGTTCATECYSDCPDYFMNDVALLHPQPETVEELNDWIDRTKDKIGKICIYRSGPWMGRWFYSSGPRDLLSFEEPSVKPSTLPVPTAPPTPAPSPTPSATATPPAPSATVPKKEAPAKTPPKEEVSWFGHFWHYKYAVVGGLAGTLAAGALVALYYRWMKKAPLRKIEKEKQKRAHEAEMKAREAERLKREEEMRALAAEEMWREAVTLGQPYNPAETRVGDGKQMQLTLDIFNRLPENGLDPLKRIEVARFLAGIIETNPHVLNDGIISLRAIEPAYKRIGHDVPNDLQNHKLSLDHVNSGVSEYATNYDISISMRTSDVMSQLHYTTISGGRRQDVLHRRAARILMFEALSDLYKNGNRGNNWDGTVSADWATFVLEKHGISKDTFDIGTYAADGTFTAADMLTVFDMKEGQYNLAQIPNQQVAQALVHQLPFETIYGIFSGQVEYVSDQLKHIPDAMRERVAIDIVVEAFLEPPEPGQKRTHLSAQRVSEILSKHGVDESLAQRVSLYPKDFTPDPNSRESKEPIYIFTDNLHRDFERVDSELKKRPEFAGLSEQERMTKAEAIVLRWHSMRAGEQQSMLGLISDKMLLKKYIPTANKKIDFNARMLDQLIRITDGTEVIPNRSATINSKNMTRELTQGIENSDFFKGLDTITQMELRGSMPDIVRALELAQQDPVFQAAFMENGVIVEAAYKTVLSGAITEGRRPWAELPEQNGIRRTRAEETATKIYKVQDEKGEIIYEITSGRRQEAWQIIRRGGK
ncbi:MAG: hypothetical protein ABH871_01010 [Pseudomonadota bacterium]